MPSAKDMLEGKKDHPTQTQIKPKPKKKIDELELTQRILTYIQDLETPTTHDKYILKVLTQEGNNQNYMAYKLRHLIKIIVKIIRR